jgi:hypothetical protein
VLFYFLPTLPAALVYMAIALERWIQSIPADAPFTLMSEPLASSHPDDTPPDGMRYRELVAHGKRRGVDYHTSFLVPIYHPDPSR